MARDGGREGPEFEARQQQRREQEAAAAAARLAARQRLADQLLSSFDPTNDSVVQQLIAQQQQSQANLDQLNQTPEFNPNPPEQAQAFEPPTIIADDSDIAELIGSTEAAPQGRTGPAGAFSAALAKRNVGQPRSTQVRRTLGGSGFVDDEDLSNVIGDSAARGPEPIPSTRSKEARKLRQQGSF